MPDPEQDLDGDTIFVPDFSNVGQTIEKVRDALLNFGRIMRETLPQQEEVRRYSATKNYFDQRQRQPKNRQARTRRPRKSERRK